MRTVNKRMIHVIHRFCMELAGGACTSGSNLRFGQNLGFVDRIHTNELFGAPLYPDLHHQAAAYMFHIVKNHSFNDGNKRTGLATAITFLEWNGWRMLPLEEDHAFEFVIGVAAGSTVPDDVIPRIATWLMRHSEPSRKG